MCVFLFFLFELGPGSCEATAFAHCDTSERPTAAPTVVQCPTLQELLSCSNKKSANACRRASACSYCANAKKCVFGVGIEGICSNTVYDHCDFGTVAPTSAAPTQDATNAPSTATPTTAGPTPLLPCPSLQVNKCFVLNKQKELKESYSVFMCFACVCSNSVNAQASRKLRTAKMRGRVVSIVGQLKSADQERVRIL